MFTEKEIALMRDCGLNMDFAHLSDDDYVKIEEVIGDELTLRCLDKDYEPNERGRLCEDLLDKLAHIG